MNAKRILFVVALMFVVGLNYSCDEETTQATDELYSIEKKDIKEEDT